MCALEDKVDPKTNTSIQVERGPRKHCAGVPNFQF